MSLIRYTPQRQLQSRSNVGNSFFDDLFGDFFGPMIMTHTPAAKTGHLNLQVDIYEKEDNIIINADLPGIAKEDISVDVKGKSVTIGAERKSDEEIQEDNCYRRERKYGKFERTFNLPFEASSDSVKANYQNGVLKLEIPKPEEQVAKKITIN